MATFDGPYGYSRKTAMIAKLRDSLGKQISQGADAQKINKVFGQFTEKQRSAVNAIDSALNRKEAEAEALDQQIMDQYPAGTYGGGLKSRNVSEYGIPPQLPVDSQAAIHAQEQNAMGARPFPMVPNPLYREGSLLPKMIPSDLAEQLIKQSQMQ